jgi:hypothetical protein
MEKGTFMHGKGFIKFEVAFQFFLRMFFKEIKALQTSACLMYGERNAIPRPFWLIGLCVASISFTGTKSLSKSHLVASISLRDWKIHVICYLFHSFSSESAKFFSIRLWSDGNSIETF